MMRNSSFVQPGQEEQQHNLDRLNQQVQSLLYQVSQHDFKTDQLKQEITALKSQVKTRDAQLDKQNRFVQEFQKLLELKEKEKQNLQSHIAFLQEDATDKAEVWNQQITERQKMLAQQSGQLEEANARIIQLQTQLIQTQQTCKQTLQQMEERQKKEQHEFSTDFKRKYEKALANLEEKQGEIQELQRKYKASNDRIDVLEAQLLQQKETVQMMREQHAREVSIQTISQDTHVKVMAQLRLAASDLGAQQSKSLQGESPLKELSSAREELQKAQAKAQQAQEVSTQLLKERQMMEKDLQNKLDEIRLLQKRIKEQPAMSTIEKQLLQQEQLISQLKLHARDMEARMRDQSTLIHDYQTQIMELRNRTTEQLAPSPTSVPKDKIIHNLQKDQLVKQNIIQHLRKQLDELHVEQQQLFRRGVFSQATTRARRPLFAETK